MARSHARAGRGRRAPGKVPWGRWERLTVIGALALDGVVASMSVAAATGTAVFLAFVEQALVPARPGALVVMDNQPRRAQGRGGPGRARQRWAGPPLPAALFAGPEPHRAGLV